MSSSEDNRQPSTSAKESRKRKINRACDICRRKKTRCDGAEMPDKRCLNCIAYDSECTYAEAATKRGPSRVYVESLEKRLENLENLLRNANRDDEFLADVDDNKHDRSQYGIIGGLYEAGAPSTTSGADEEPALSDDEDRHDPLTSDLEQMQLNPIHRSFFGKSSGVAFTQQAFDMKREYAGQEPLVQKYGKIPPMYAATVKKRPEYWKSWQPPDMADIEPLMYRLPPVDLLSILVGLYFTHVNIFHPLLHRPTFEASVERGLHHRHRGFAGVLMLVCANGARFSSDPRVLTPDRPSYLAGWQWFDQVNMMQKSMLTAPTLHDLQQYNLAITYLLTTNEPQSAWSMIGIGLRLAQDVGAHRRKMYSRKGTVEDEQWKRAFWVLVCHDRFLSVAIGRPCAIHDEDFDIYMPIECDDEYWQTGNPDTDFKQPQGKPSFISAFVYYIKLSQILAYMMRTIYSIKRSKILLGFVGQHWEQRIVSDLDSALNKWVDGVPGHMRWDPTMENLTFLTLSANIYVKYYYLRTLVHRPFIALPGQPPPLPFPSLEIATNAGRSASRIMGVVLQRCTTSPPCWHAVFSSAVVLLMSVWGWRRTGRPKEPTQVMKDVHTCLDALRANETRWSSCGQLWDILAHIVSASELSRLSADSSSCEPNEAGGSAPGFVDSSKDSSHLGVGASLGGFPASSPNEGVDDFPKSSNELGRMPVHGQRDYSPYSAPETTWPTPSQSTVESEQGQDLSNGYGIFAVDKPSIDYVSSTFQAWDAYTAGALHPLQDMGQDFTQFFDSSTMGVWSNAPTGFQ